LSIPISITQYNLPRGRGIGAVTWLRQLRHPFGQRACGVKPRVVETADLRAAHFKPL
jgi:hypothetical protein